MNVFGITHRRAARAARASQPSGERTPGARGALPAFLAGSALGFVLAAVLKPRIRRGERDPEAAAAMRSLANGWSQLGESWQQLVESWVAMMERTRQGSGGAVDVEALSERLRALPGGEGVSVRLLDSGIVEVTGDVESEANARALLDAVAEEGGVRVVLNRTWLGEVPASGPN